jgi:hypothetical protein
VYAGFGLLSPDIGCIAWRSGMSPGRALVPDGGADLPAVDDTTAVDGAVAAGTASIGGIACARAKTGQYKAGQYK